MEKILPHLDVRKFLDIAKQKKLSVSCILDVTRFFLSTRCEAFAKVGKLYCNHRASQKLNTDQIRKETPFPKPSVQDCQGGSHENRCTIQPCCRVYGTELVQRNCKLVNTGGRCLRALKKVKNVEMRLPLWQGDHSWALEPKGMNFFGPPAKPMSGSHNHAVLSEYKMT